MNDFELFQAMTDAQEKYDALLKEYRRRGLDKKAYCQFSRFEDKSLFCVKCGDNAVNGTVFCTKHTEHVSDTSTKEG